MATAENKHESECSRCGTGASGKLKGAFLVTYLEFDLNFGCDFELKMLSHLGYKPSYGSVVNINKYVVHA